jgi:hypothetical protein
MINRRSTRWKNRLLAWMSWISELSETGRLLQAAHSRRRDGWTVPPLYFVRRAMLIFTSPRHGRRNPG